VFLLVIQLFLTATAKPVLPANREPVPPRIEEFIRYLKSVAPAKRGSLVPRKPINPAVLLGYVSADGLSIADVNAPPHRIPPEQLRQELKAGRGPAVRYIVHVAVMLSELGETRPEVERTERNVRLLLPSYNLVFSNDKSAPKLEAIECITPDGD